MFGQFRQLWLSETKARTGGLGIALCLLAVACSNPVDTDGGATATATFTLQGPPENGLSGPMGGPFPTGTREYNLLNNGNHDLHYHGTSEGDWMILSPSSSVIAPGSNQRITVSIDGAAASQLAVGTYRSMIRAASNPNAQGAVVRSFVLTVYEPSPGGHMAVSPADPWNFSNQAGASMPGTQRTFTVSNSGDDSFSWSVAASQPWLAVVGSSNGDLDPDGSAQVAVAVDTQVVQGFSAGEYDALVSFVNTTNGLGNMQIPVQFTSTQPDPGPGGRVTDGLISLYGFEEGSGQTVYDQSGVAPAMDLNITSMNGVAWSAGRLSVQNATNIMTMGPATKLIEACRATNAITIETWISPDNVTQSGPARIVTLSDNNSSGAHVMLGQGRWGSQASDVYTVRLTTTENTGEPALTTPSGAATLGLSHVVFTRDSGGTARIYVDGTQVTTMPIPGNYSNWEMDYSLALGNEIGAARPWAGDLHLVALYDRALSSAEVGQNHSAGTADAQTGHLAVTPGSNFSASVIEGESLAGEAKNYALTNSGTDDIDWAVTASEPWIVLANATVGTLAPGQSHELLVRFQDSLASGFAPGQYSGTLSFVNQTNGFGNDDREVALTILSEGDPAPNGGGSSPDGLRPGPTNTGPTNPSILTAYTGPNPITQDGTVIENKIFNTGVKVWASNVTIRNFKINANGALFGLDCNDAGPGCVFEDGEIIEAAAAGIKGRNWTARRLNIHECHKDVTKPQGNVLMEDCWLHNSGTNPSSHADGAQISWGSNITLRRNNFDMPIPESVNGTSGYKSNSNIFIRSVFGPVDNILIEQNWLNGGNFTVYLNDWHENGEPFGLPTNVRVINNIFSGTPDYRYGYWRHEVPSAITTGNTWEFNGAPVIVNMWDNALN